MIPSAPGGRYEGALPPDFRSHLKAHLAEYGCPMRDDADRIEVTFGAARIRLRVTPDLFEVAYPDAADVALYTLRELTLYLLDHLHPPAGAGIVWHGFAETTGTPPNFHLAHVLGRERLSPGFVRVWLGCEGVAALDGGAMHFSLLLPPEGQRPVWPQLDGKGRTIWPKGAAQLHRAAYTFVTFEPAAGRFAFDVFLHAGGRVSDWALTAPVGSVVGITGPGGGDFPPGQNLLLAGDETALPAIRRILEHSEPTRNCTVLLETGRAEDRLLPAGPNLRWIDRSAGETLWQALRETPAPAGDRFVWVAAEQATARRAKDHFRKTFGLKATEGYFSGYWSR